MPNRLIVLPNRVKDRMEHALPKSSLSNVDNDEPRRTMPYTERDGARLIFLTQRFGLVTQGVDVQTWHVWGHKLFILDVLAECELREELNPRQRSLFAAQVPPKAAMAPLSSSTHPQ